MRAVGLAPRSTVGVRSVLSPPVCHEFDRVLDELRGVLVGRSIWHVNSTAASGGVAELLASLLPYAAGRGVDVHWQVIDGDTAFFAVTKRLHNRLHEDPGDGGPLGADERRVRTSTRWPVSRGRWNSRSNRAMSWSCTTRRPSAWRPRSCDVARRVVWRCHIGVDHPGPLACSGWDFLRPDVEAAEIAVFSRAAYRWDGLSADRVVVVPPCIDVMSLKNRPLDRATAEAVLAAAGIVERDRDGPAASRAAPSFTRRDGSSGEVRHSVQVVQERPIPPRVPFVVQVSRGTA